MENITVNRAQPSGEAGRPHNQRPSAGAPSSRKLKGVRRPLLIIGAILLVALAATGVLYALSKAGVAGTIDSNKYQAVFFTNGQVYFGKLKAMNGDYMRLTDVYYLQEKTSTNESNPQEASAQDASDVELIKLGSEIHGPEDEMLVSKDQILFFENLKPAGSVSQTISNFQKSKQ